MSHRRIHVLLFALPVLCLMAADSMANSPPVVSIDHLQSPSRLYTVHSPVYLAAQASDPDGDAIVQWQWRIVNSPSGGRTFLSTCGIPQVCFHPDRAGDYVIAACASDGASWSRTVTTVVHVYEPRSARQSIRSTSLSGAVPQGIRYNPRQDHLAERLVYRIYRFYAFLLQLVGLIDAGA